MVELIDTIHGAQVELARDVGLIGNIFTLLFHALVIHFTGILIHREAFRAYPGIINPPWVNQRYATEPFFYKNLGTEGTRPFIGQAKDLLKVPGLWPVSIGESIPYGYQQNQIISKAISLLCSVETPSGAYLPYRNKQLDRLGDVVESICRTYEIPKSRIVRTNLTEYARKHSIATTCQIKNRGLIVGTRLNIENRKHAINFLQQGKRVIAFTHGEVSNLIYKEPFVNYSERALCTDLVEYGDVVAPEYRKGPCPAPARIIKRDSEVAKQNFRLSDSIDPNSLGKANALYIPTLHQGNYLWGPWHNLEDFVYDRWQNALIRNLGRLTVKIHPKTRSEREYSCALELRRLEDCLKEYELFVIDHFGTGAVLATLSDKPVVYFDLGLRRFDKEFSKALDRRCCRVSIDLNENLDAQLRHAMVRYNEGFGQSTNEEIAKYSICDDPSMTMIGAVRQAGKR